MDNEEVKIDFKELQKQRKEQFINSGKYCLAEIVIGKNDNIPVAHIEVQNVSSEEVAELIKVMEIMIDQIAKKDPAAYKISREITNKGGAIISEW